MHQSEAKAELEERLREKEEDYRKLIISADQESSKKIADAKAEHELRLSTSKKQSKLALVLQEFVRKTIVKELEEERLKR